MMTRKLDQFERGIYSIPEASRLAGIDKRSISRWIRGYQYLSRGQRKSSPSVFRPDYSKVEGHFYLSFLDLMELRFVKAFRQHGLSFPKIRLASQRAAEILKTSHPFAVNRFFTDRRSIFTKIAEDEGDPELLDLIKGQFEIENVISPLLVAGVVYSDDYPSRWYPLGKEKSIFIDPRYSFGQPVLAAYAIPTATLYAAYQAEGSYKKVATWFEIEEQAVRKAVSFESNLAA